MILQIDVSEQIEKMYDEMTDDEKEAFRAGYKIGWYDGISETIIQLQNQLDMEERK